MFRYRISSIPTQKEGGNGGEKMERPDRAGKKQFYSMDFLHSVQYCTDYCDNCITIKSVLIIVQAGGADNRKEGDG